MWRFGYESVKIPASNPEITRELKINNKYAISYFREKSPSTNCSNKNNKNNFAWIRFSRSVPLKSPILTQFDQMILIPEPTSRCFFIGTLYTFIFFVLMPVVYVRSHTFLIL